VARQGAPPHRLLEIDAGTGAEAAQDAFHKIARMAHPDLHRHSLTAEELELVTTAYARVTAAYQELRDALRPGASGAMSPKALPYYRKAERCLRRGELGGAVLQLKLAIASDPQSAFLRSALAEVEAEVGK
jgi:hypothetical protein